VIWFDRGSGFGSSGEMIVAEAFPAMADYRPASRRLPTAGGS